MNAPGHPDRSEASPALMGINIAGVVLNSPLMLAAGTAGYVDELSDVCDLSAVGAIITKSITPEPRPGNEPPRIAGTRLGMLNAIGLANVGLDQFLAEKLPQSNALNNKTILIGSIAGHSLDDYVRVASAFDERDELPIVELNVSCPNTSDGLIFGEDPKALSELVHAVRPVLNHTKMIVKLSPNAPSVVAVARSAVESGADAISLINTFTALAVDVETRKPIISRGKAGLSGAGIHPIAVRMVSDVYREVAKPSNTPIIAYGGVMTWEDAAEFILVGASAVGMGTALFVDPAIPKRIFKGLTKWVNHQGASSISELAGLAELE